MILNHTAALELKYFYWSISIENNIHKSNLLYITTSTNAGFFGGLSLVFHRDICTLTGNLMATYKQIKAKKAEQT